MTAVAAPIDRAPGAWARALPLIAVAALIILVMFWRDAAQIFGIWWNISTYNHCLLLVPILGWLVMQRKDELAELTPAAWWPGLMWSALAALFWLIGQALDINFARHLALVMMLQGAVVALTGPMVARGLAFPLFFSFFLVPFGDELIYPLQIVTAEISMAMLGWSGIPAHIAGLDIATPAGLFHVAEACSGVKFLIAMLALGALVANLCFRSSRRRAAFLAACVIVPIVANGIRAWGTITIAHHRGLDFAAGFDHIFYGWIFFAVVIAVVLAAAWPFFDKNADAPAFEPSYLQRPFLHVARPVPMIAALIGLAALPLAIAAILL